MGIHKKYKLYDFFDTIVSRKNSPLLIKKEWSKKISEIFNNYISSEIIFNMRLSVEESLDKNKENGEYTYTEIINEMKNRISTYFTNISNKELDKFSSIALDLEEQLELNNAYINKDVYKMLRNKNDGELNICVSDFYMPTKSIVKIMKKLDIYKFYDAIYVSCDHGVNKRKGNLYEKVIKENNINPDECIMIGDNKFSDILMAKKYGMDTLKVNRKKTFNKYYKNNKDNDSKFYNEIKKVCKKNISGYIYENYFISIYLFVQKLYYELVKNKYDDVIFLSREGEFLKKVFDLYQANKIKKINTHYMLISRNSILKVALDCKKIDLKYLCENYLKNKSTIKELFKTLSFSKEEIELFEKSYNLKEILNVKDSQNVFYKLICDEKFKGVYEKKIGLQYDAFEAYFSSFNLGEKEDFVLVDVGWKGTMQDILSSIFNERKIIGYYMGLTSESSSTKMSKKYGMLFSDYPINGIGKIYKYGSINYEEILKASHNRVDGYHLEKGNPQIIYNEEDNSETYNKYIANIQKAMIEKIENIISIESNFFAEVTDQEWIVGNILKKMMISQRIKDYKMLNLCDQKQINGFGTDNTIGKLKIKRILKNKLREFIYFVFGE